MATYRNILSVDWDFFIPVSILQEMDWGHDERFAPALQEMLWIVRASGMIANNEPLLETSGDEIGFWDRFQFDDDMQVFIADSHMHMCDPRLTDKIVFNVWNFDAHHDAAFRESALEDAKVGKTDCANWLAWYTLSGSQTRVVYPSWRDLADAGKPHCEGVEVTTDSPEACYDLPFNTLYICKSSSWTPPWLDSKFEKLLYDLRQRLPRTDFLKIEDTSPRLWDEEQVNAHAAATRQQMEDLQELNRHVQEQ